LVVVEEEVYKVVLGELEVIEKLKLLLLIHIQLVL
jgi:hypothetical protein